MLCALLSLPLHLLHRCLSACLRLLDAPVPSEVLALLKALPLPLRQPLIAAAVAANGTLKVTDSADCTIYALLSSTPMPPPGLRALEVSVLGDVDEEDFVPTRPVTRAEAALLARTFTSHSTLTRIEFDTVRFEPDSLEQLAASLPRGSLPQLVHLGICTAEHKSSCGALLDVVRPLRALTKLHINLWPNRSPGGPALASLLRSAASPACLPGLQHLVVGEDEPDNGGQESYGQGCISANQLSCIPAFLPLIHAPALMSLEVGPSQIISYRHLWPYASLAHFTTMQELVIVGELRDEAPCLAMREDVDASPPTLTSISVLSQCPVSPLLSATFATLWAPQMTALVVSSYPVEQFFASACSIGGVMDAWAALLPAIGRCTSLQRLTLAALCGVHTGEAVMSHSIAVAAALKPLTGLTVLDLCAVGELVLKDSYCCLHGLPLGNALAALTGLQTLRICSGCGMLEIEEPQHVLDACTGLAKLSWLGLCMHTEQDVQLPKLLPKLTALQELRIGDSVLQQAGGDTDFLAAKFPKITCEECKCLPLMYAELEALRGCKPA